MNKYLAVSVALFAVVGFIGFQSAHISTLEKDIELERMRSKEAIDNRDLLAAHLLDVEQSKKELIAQIKYRETVIASRELALNESRQELAELSERLNELRSHNDEFQKWNQAHIPDAFIGLLRHARHASDHQDGG